MSQYADSSPYIQVRGPKERFSPLFFVPIKKGMVKVKNNLVQSFIGYLNRGDLESLSEHDREVIHKQELLIMLARSKGVRYVYKKDENRASYNLYLKRIEMGHPYSVPSKRSLVTFAHELGHHVDMNKRCIDLDKFLKEDRIRLEVFAWFESIRILHKIKFDDWNIYLEYGYECLGSYYDSFYREKSNFPLSLGEVMLELSILITDIRNGKRLPDRFPEPVLNENLA